MATTTLRLACVGVVGALAYHALTLDPEGRADQNGKHGGRTGSAIVAAALAQRGVPYAWGGGGPRGKSRGICCSPSGANGRKVVGFDCSGLVQYAVYRATDGRITLPRVAQQQARQGKPVSRGHMKPGDLIGFDHGRGITHIGIYIGGGKMVHAPRSGDVVKVSPLAPRAQQRWKIRRIR